MTETGNSSRGLLARRIGLILGGLSALGAYAFVGRAQLSMGWADLAVGLWAAASFAIGWGPALATLWAKTCRRQEFLLAAFLSNLALLLALCMAFLFAGHFARGPVLLGWTLTTVAVLAICRGRGLRGYARWAREFEACVTSSWMSFFLFLVWCSILVHAILYPYTAWDTLMRYAWLGRRFVARQALHYPCLTPDEFRDFTMPEGYPPLIPALFGWFYLWTLQDLPSHLLSPAFLGFHLLAISCLARRIGVTRLPEMAAILYMCFPRVLYFAYQKDGYVDEPVTFFFTCAVLALFSARAGAGLCLLACGLAAWTKFNAFLLIPLLGIAAGWSGAWKRALMGGLGLGLSLPWLLRNLQMVGDPLYPMLYPILGDDSGWLNDLLYKEAYGIWELGRWAVAKEITIATMGPEGFLICAILACLATFAGWKEKRTWSLWAMSLVMFLAALIQRRYELRLVQFLLVPLCLLGGLGWRRLRWGQTGMACLLACWIVLACSGWARCPALGLKWNHWTDLAASYEGKREALLAPASGLWALTERLAQDAVVLLPDSRHYAIPRTCLSLRNPLLKGFFEAKTPDEKRSALRALGITHALIYDPSLPQESLLVDRSRFREILLWPGTRLVASAPGGCLMEIGPP